MSKCINTANAEFKSLVEISGISSIELAAKMNLWMEDNNTDVWPSLSQLGLTTEEATESTEPISNTETIEDSYMANFGDDVNAKHEVSEFAKSEFDFNDEIDNEQKPEFSLDDEALSNDEKKTGQNLSFAKLTQTLIYQHNDINNEIQNLYGKLKNAKKDERHIIKSNIAKTNQKRQELAEKIKQSKKLSNLEQVVEFGNDAYNEVLSILEAGNLTDKQLNYVDRIVKF